MANEENRDDEENNVKDGDYAGESANRARNRTVMLTPEITGQVRARLAQELDERPQAFPGFNNAASGRMDSLGASRSMGAETQSSIGQNDPFGSPYMPAKESSSFGLDTASGSRKQPAPAVQSNAPANLIWSKETPIVGFLVSFDNNSNGEVYPLRSGRLIISNEAAGAGSYLVLNDDSVSSMHAILRISPTGEVQVLDQLSEVGTRIKRFGVEQEETISGEKSTIEHGDVIKFGNRTFHVCILALNA